MHIWEVSILHILRPVLPWVLGMKLPHGDGVRT